MREREWMDGWMDGWMRECTWRIILARLQRWISGTESSWRLRKASSGNSRKHYMGELIYGQFIILHSSLFIHHSSFTTNLSFTFSTCTTSSLPSMRLWNRRDQQRLQSRGCLTHTDLHHAGIHHILDSLDGDGRLGDVGGENDFTGMWRSRREDHELLLRR